MGKKRTSEEPATDEAAPAAEEADPVAPDYVDLRSKDDEGRVLHVVRQDWEKWGRPKTIEELHANRAAKQD